MAQLQKLAERGSRRAKAELEGRLRALGASPAPQSAPMPLSAPAPLPAAAPRAHVPPAAAHPSRASVPPAMADAPARPSAHAAQAAQASAMARTDAAALPAATALAGAGAAQQNVNAALQGNEALAQQIEMIARQSGDRARADGPPRLVGMVLIGWGALLVLASLTMLTRGAGWFYLFCGAGTAAVGWLLMQCSRWAMAAHGVLLVVGLAWAWGTEPSRNFGFALVQAAPLAIAALWMALRQVRDALE